MKEVTSIRIPEAIKREMERHKEINWSEFIRNQIMREINYPKAPKKMKELVTDYVNNDAFDKLWILHMFSEGIQKRYIYENTKLIFGEDKEEQVDEVEHDLKEYGFRNLFEKIDGELYIANAIKLALDEKGVMNKFHDECAKRLKNATSEVKEGAWLLCLYIEDNLNQESAFFIPDGFEKTFSFIRPDETNEIVSEMVKLGIVYLDHYKSNAYSHWWHKIPDYALQILSEIYQGKGAKFGICKSKPNHQDIKRLLSNKKVKSFFKWMGGHKKYVNEYQENEIIEKELQLTSKEFRQLITKLVKENMLIIDYMPDRRRAGKRSSSPSKWIYKIPSSVLGELGKALLEFI